MIKALLRPFEAIGASILATVDDAGHAVSLLGKVLTWGLLAALGRIRPIVHQLYICGAQSLVVALIVGVFVGMIMALQTGLTLKQYQLQSFVGTVVLVTLLKELGPFMCAFILAGRVGAAMAAELGTMRVNEEIDALRSMSIDPISFLVVPRVLALAIVAPMLTVYVDVIGVIGGGLVAQHQIGVAPAQYYGKVWELLEGADLVLLYGGMVKAIVFGLLIAGISCSNGLRTTRGAAGVGEASRKSVVQSFLMILITNYFMSSLINRYF